MYGKLICGRSRKQVVESVRIALAPMYLTFPTVDDRSCARKRQELACDSTGDVPLIALTFEKPLMAVGNGLCESQY
jgi:hypothetical protein